MISIWTNCFDWQSWARNNFLASQQRQRDNEKQRNRASGAMEKIRKIVRYLCQDGVATTDLVKWQLQTTLWPENMFKMSQQYCRVPCPALLIGLKHDMYNLGLFKLL